MKLRKIRVKDRKCDLLESSDVESGEKRDQKERKRKGTRTQVLELGPRD